MKVFVVCEQELPQSLNSNILSWAGRILSVETNIDSAQKKVAELIGDKDFEWEFKKNIHRIGPQNEQHKAWTTERIYQKDSSASSKFVIFEFGIESQDDPTTPPAQRASFSK